MEFKKLWLCAVILPALIALTSIYASADSASVSEQITTGMKAVLADYDGNVKLHQVTDSFEQASFFGNYVISGNLIPVGLWVDDKREYVRIYLQNMCSSGIESTLAGAVGADSTFLSQYEGITLPARIGDSQKELPGIINDNGEIDYSFSLQPSYVTIKKKPSGLTTAKIIEIDTVHFQAAEIESGIRIYYYGVMDDDTLSRLRVLSDDKDFDTAAKNLYELSHSQYFTANGIPYGKTRFSTRGYLSPKKFPSEEEMISYDFYKDVYQKSYIVTLHRESSAAFYALNIEIAGQEDNYYEIEGLVTKMLLTLNLRFEPSAGKASTSRAEYFRCDSVPYNILQTVSYARNYCFEEKSSERCTPLDNTLNIMLQCDEHAFGMSGGDLEFHNYWFKFYKDSSIDCNQNLLNSMKYVDYSSLNMKNHDYNLKNNKAIQDGKLKKKFEISPLGLQQEKAAYDREYPD